jgi:alkylation response protein AidB-like acyl-CoA dehydrogenase
MVTEELAKADSGFGVAFAVNALGSFPIILGGTEEQKQRGCRRSRAARSSSPSA